METSKWFSWRTFFQIYTEQGSSQVDWNTDLTKGINKPIIWFQARFHLDHLVPEDLNANPVLMEMIYSLIQSICHDKTSCCCQQAQINCLKPTQRYYHIPSDWLMAKNNLLTVFNDLGASSPRSVGLIQRVVIV